MGVSLGQAILYLRGDRSHLSRELDAAESETKSWANRMNSVASGVGGFFKNALSFAAGGVILQGLNAVTAGIGNVARGMIDGNAQFETYEASFATLMGSTQQARAHLDDLATFAAKTPFELPEIITASRNMYTLGGAAFATQANLTMVGNAAAATGQKVDEVAFWTSRAYNAIQNGQPWGEAAMRLQEMGILGGEARNYLEALQKEGAKGPEVWAAFTQSINAPSDAMDKLGQTWTGLKSTLQDTFAAIIRAAGQPLFDKLKPQLSGLIETLNTPQVMAAAVKIGTVLGDVVGGAVDWLANTAIPWLVDAWYTIGPAVNTALDWLGDAWDFFSSLGSEALNWGSNITAQLAQGIYDGAAYVMDALSWVGDQITYWLEPHSPPKLLPNLDKWGAEAAKVYMDGWTDPASFKVFDSIASVVEDGLRSLVDIQALPEGGIVEMIVGSRAAIAEAIKSLGETGDVTQEIIDKVRFAAAPAGSAVQDLAESLVKQADAVGDLEQAQDELNETTEKYDGILNGLKGELDAIKEQYEDILGGLEAELKQVNRAFDQREDPIDDQLAAIEAQEQAIEDAERMAELHEIINDESKSQAEKDKARLELQKIALEQQQRAIEAERDAAVEAIEDKIDATEAERDAAVTAQEQKISAAEAERKAAVDAAQAKVDAATAAAEAAAQEVAVRQAVVEQQQKVNDLLKEQIALEEKAAKAAEKGKKGGGKKGGAAKPKGGGAKPPVKPTAPGPKADEESAADSEGERGIGGILARMGPQISRAQQMATQLKTAVAPVFGWFSQNTGAVIGGIAGLAAALLLPAMPALTLGGALAPIGSLLSTGLLPYIMALVNPLNLAGIAFSMLGGVMSFLLSPIVLLTVGMAALGAAWQQNVGGIQQITQTVFGQIGTLIQTVLGVIMTAWQTHGAAIMAATSATWNTIVQTVGGVLAAVMQVVSSVLSVVQSFIEQHGATIMANLTSAWQTIMGIVQTVMQILQATIIPILAGIATFIMTHRDQIVGVLKAGWELIYSIIKTALDLIQGVLNVVLAAVQGDWDGAWKAMDSLLSTTWDNIKTVMGAALEWVEKSIALVWEVIKTAASSLGGDVINGIIQGVENKATELYGKLKEIANNALNAAKEALGIKSPSRVFAAQVGRWIPAGIAEGVSKYAKLAHEAVRDMGVQLGDMRVNGPQLATAGGLVGAGSLKLQPLPPAPQAVQPISVPINVEKIENREDIEVLAARIAQVIKRKQR